ncbi:MAG TPA: molybdopterin-guanine dinucleotide biosynthesis protein B [Rhodobacteraceae bacterium]|nr:molybdopterin-guanine dinucleotide biosynthesis protein B [Amylibacter sp.]MDG1999822.1 molybdopterin-guanine dinucleotide biosynthesis protein B [Amylibacter sp.]HAD27233.1 molybdopterin-guanine dinucleotide biosynthesis protein B [Paracoccaceae bacterium]
MKVFGITGWKNSGKTGLVERLVTELSFRGFTVSTIKHAHHSFDVDYQGRDSYRHREAGACEVLLSSGNRWALMHELRGADEMSLADLLSKLTPVDVVLVEGFKTEGHEKLECHRASTSTMVIGRADDTIIGIASDIELDVELPFFDLNDTKVIADFMLTRLGLE